MGNRVSCFAALASSTMYYYVDVIPVSKNMTQMLSGPKSLSLPGRRESIVNMASLVEPLTKSNIRKGKIVQKLRENWSATIHELLEGRPDVLIGLRLKANVFKLGLFHKGQRGVVTDIEILPNKSYIYITWDNVAPNGVIQLPPQRIVKFNVMKVWQYVEPVMCNQGVDSDSE